MASAGWFGDSWHMKKPTVEQVAALFKATPEQVRSAYRKNAAEMREMALNKPEKRGTTAGYLNAKASEFESK